jgi:hypothetical protein
MVYGKSPFFELQDENKKISAIKGEDKFDIVYKLEDEDANKDAKEEASKSIKNCLKKKGRATCAELLKYKFLK